MATTVKIILDIRRMKKKTGKYPVKLQVTYQRLSEHYHTPFELTKDEFAKVNSSRLTNELQTIKDKLKAVSRISHQTS